MNFEDEKGLNSFPWRLLKKMAITQVVVLLLGTLLFSFSFIHTTRSFKDSYFSNQADKDSTLKTVQVNNWNRFEKNLTLHFVIYFIFLLSVSLLSGLKMALPLGKLVSKLERLKRVSPQKEEDLGLALFDEWDMVENTLDRAKESIESYIDEVYLENQKLVTLMESISESILAVDLSYKLLFANRPFKKMFLPKSPTKKELKNFNIWNLTHTLELQNLFHEANKKDQSLKRSNLSLFIRGGSEQKIFDLTVSPLKGKGGKIYGVVCVFHDVTERKMNEQMREDFVSNVSHEVRTPLTALKGYVQILNQKLGKNNPEISPIVGKILSNSDRLTNLFNDILNLGLIESKKDISKEQIPLADITGDVISNVKQGYQEKVIDIETNYKVDFLWGNSSFIEQVITNLVENAYKYAPNNGKILVSWEKSDQKKLLKVQNSGPPIPKKHHPRIFERFYRVDDSRSRSLGGTGLGLAIVKHIVQKHRGEVYMSSDQDNGTIFTASFPS